MAIILDSTASFASTAFSTVMSWNHTCNGANRMLVVSYQYATSIANTPVATYAGTTMTLHKQVSVGSGVIQAGIFAIQNPTTGLNVISISVASGIMRPRIGESISFTSVNSTTPIRSTGGTTAASSISSATLLGVFSSDMAIDSVVFDVSTAITTGSGQVLTFATSIVDVTYGIAGGQSREAVTSTSVVMTWTQVGTPNNGIAVLVLAEATDVSAARIHQVIWAQ